MRRSATSFEAEQIALGEPRANFQPSERGPAVNSIGIAFDSVEKRFGSLVALKNISLEIGGGEFVALLGANGAGKTTLLRIAAQLMKPTSGSIALTGVTPDSGDARRFIGFVGHSTLLYDELSAEENLSLFAELYGLDNERVRVGKSLEACGLGSRAGSLVRTFSRGMRQRLAIARALLHEPRLLLLDEPAAGLDLGGREELVARLADLAADPESPALVLVTHHVEEIPEGFSHCLILSEGTVVDSGLLTDVLTAENLSTAFGQSIALEYIDGRYFARRTRTRAAHRRRM